MWAIGTILGILIGAAVDHGTGAALGGFIGFVLGLWAGRDRNARAAQIAGLETRLTQLTGDVAALREGSVQRLAATGARQADDAFATASIDTVAPRLPAQASAVEAASALSAAVPPDRVAIVALPVRKGGSGVDESASVDSAPKIELPASAPVAPAPKPAWLVWVLGGNSLARIGALILLIGVGFLLKFATEHVVVPIEVRLAGVALGGTALLVVGWRLRSTRAGYAMILQGVGVGVMYLTIFAALRLYALLPPTAAFALLFLVAAFSSLLAIRQDAVALAALAVVGGFLAPILTSSGSGNHVLLFGYYALLNASILAIAWFRAWRVLNVLGFAFTFVVAVIWGVTRYRAEYFASTEPFLVLSFVFYVAIALLYALKRSVALRDYVDSTLVFGTPLIVAALQSALVRDMPFGMAISALIAAAIYLSLARALYARRDESVRMLVEAFLALGVIFATLAIPLGFDARWTSATWALEGAGLLWVGVRQQRTAARVFGVLLQVAAGVALGLGLQVWHGAPPAQLVPVLNSDCIGAVLVALAGLFSAWLLQRRNDAIRPWEQALAMLMFAWGTLWWLFAGWHEIERWTPSAMHLSAAVGLLTLTALLFAIAEKAGRWPTARAPVLALLPILLLLATGSIGDPMSTGVHLFAHGGFLTWPLAVVAMVVLLRRYDEPDAAFAGTLAAPLDWWHAGLLWLVAFIVAQESAWIGTRFGSGDGVWSMVAWGLVAAATLFTVTGVVDKPIWPMNRHRTGYLIFGALPVAVLLALWSLTANFNGDADPAPLPYVPLFNPLDITEVLALLAMATWVVRLQRDGAHLGGLLRPAIPAVVLATLLFVWINAIVLRSIHFWYDVPYTVDALWDSRLVQAAMSLLWSSLALATMVLANRRHWRPAWIGGAALLGLVVVKLFLVDLSQVGGVERIVSFIGVGLLLLLIGFLAPVPPRRMEAS